MNVLKFGIGKCRFQFMRRTAGQAFRISALLGAALFGFLAMSSVAPGQTANFHARNVEIRVFPDDSIQQIAVCRIDSVFTEYRKIGFFRVRLLPRLVAEGVQLEFDRPDGGTNWLDGLQFDPAPGVGRSAVEWRGFSVRCAPETLPRLRAKRVTPLANAGATVYRLEGVTLRTEGGELAVPKAELRTDGESGQVSWTHSGQVIRWNLFTGQCRTNSVKPNANEKL